MCRAVHKLKSKGKKKDEKLNVATKFSQNEVKKNTQNVHVETSNWNKKIIKKIKRIKKYKKASCGYAAQTHTPVLLAYTLSDMPNIQHNVYFI